jgi:hypothetical protein
VSTAIQQIRERVEEILENIVPDVRPDITLRRWLGSRDITTGEHTESAAVTTRQFQVVALPVREAGFLGGGSVDQWQTLQITIRYYIADRPDGWTEVHDLAASDSAAIFEALMESDQWTGTQAEGAALGDAVPLTRSPTIANIGVQVLNYRVLYNRCTTGSGGSFSAHFFTLGALLAYLDTKPKSTVAKLVNARTREIIGVWVKDAIEASYCDFSLADGTEFADGTDLIKQAGASYTITYGTGIVIAGGAVEFYGFARLANSDLLFIGTTTTYQREKLHKYTSQADINLVTGVADQVVALVASDGTLTQHERWNGAAWDTLTAGGSGVVTEHTTLASLFGQVAVAGDRAVLKTSADRPVAIGRYDGTRWILDGLIDFAAAGVEGATIFGAYIQTDGTSTITWTANGFELGNVTASAQRIFLQFVSSPLAWDTDLRRIIVHATSVLAAPMASGPFTACGVVWGVAAARTYVGEGAVQWRSVSTKRVLAYYGAPLATPSVGIGTDFNGTTTTAEKPYVDCGYANGANAYWSTSAHDSSLNDGDDLQVVPSRASTGLDSGKSLKELSFRGRDASGDSVLFSNVTVQLQGSP